MISKRETIKYAKYVMDEIFGEHGFYRPKYLEIRFVKHSPKRVLKFGFCRLVPGHYDGSNLLEEKVVIHIRHRDRRMPVENMLQLLAHELGHVKQIVKHILKQDPKTGVITYCGQEYVHRYNVHYGNYQVTPRGQFKAIPPPWEMALVESQKLVARIVANDLSIEDAA